MKKVHTNKGFTMAELLIVVAIIAILVAIAIPTFSDQMERAREGVDLSALRNGYTEAAAVFTTTKDKTYDYKITYKQTSAGWAIDTTEFPATSIKDLVTPSLPSGEQTVTFTRTGEGSTTPGKWSEITLAKYLTANYTNADVTIAENTLDLPTGASDQDIAPAVAGVSYDGGIKIAKDTALTSLTAVGDSIDIKVTVSYKLDDKDQTKDFLITVTKTA